MQETGERVTVLETSFRAFQDEYRRDMQELKTDMKSCLEQQRTTNGRVTTIQAERAAEKAVQDALTAQRARVRGILTTWVAPIVAAVAGGVVVFFFS